MAAYSPEGMTFRAMDSDSTRVIKYITHTFGDALPTTFPATSMSYNGPNINYYLVVGR